MTVDAATDLAHLELALIEPAREDLEDMNLTIPDPEFRVARLTDTDMDQERR